MLGYNVVKIIAKVFLLMLSIQTRAAALLFRVLLVSVLLSPWALSQAQSLKLTASIRPLALLAQDLTRELPVSITTLLPANADPHSWALRISDRQTLEASDLVLWLGPEFEGFLAKALASADTYQLRLDTLPDLQWPHEAQHDHDDPGHDHHHSGRDLHLWLNPANARVIQRAIAAKLIQLRPQWRDTLEQRLEQQLQHLAELQADLERRLSPHRQKGFLAYHDAYGHFVEALGLRQLGAVNQSSEQRLSAKALGHLQAQARDSHCLLVERRGEAEQRLGKTLKLPLVVADGLAADTALNGFPELLRHIGQAFEDCFAARAK
jgi:zinc transport system substrate-binding protein